MRQRDLRRGRAARAAEAFQMAQAMDAYGLSPALVAALTFLQLRLLVFHRRDRHGALVPPGKVVKGASLPRTPEAPPPLDDADRAARLEAYMKAFARMR